MQKRHSFRKHKTCHIMKNIAVIMALSSGTMGSLPVMAAETTTEPQALTSVSYESVESSFLVSQLTAMQSYILEKNDNTQSQFEEILLQKAKQFENSHVQTDVTKNEDTEGELQWLESRDYRNTLNNDIHEETYLYKGQYLIKAENFFVNKAGQHKVEVQIRLLSMVEQAMVKATGSAQYLSDPNNAINSAKSETLLVTLKDVLAPVIQLKATEKEIYIGESFDAGSMVEKITDDTDENVGVIIEGNVDVQKEGTYTVTYKAKDTEGNEGTATLQVTVKRDIGKEAADLALTYRGTPYVWGGTTPSGFDCSGLVQYVYARLGISLPRVAAAQGQCGQAVSASNLKAGDLIIYGNGAHVAIYIGNGQVVHALNPGTGVTTGAWNTPYNGGVTAIRRIVS